MNVAVIIPARWASSRFPGKPLVRLCGRSMLEWVWLRANRAERIQDVIIATDDERIAEEVEKFGGRVVMTSTDHQTGTDRIAEAARLVPGLDAVINVQGDEPLIDPLVIDDLVEHLTGGDWDMVTAACTCMDPEKVSSPDVVKVVIGEKGNALYFSRLAIPFDREGDSAPQYLRHLGIYGYTVQFLERYVEAEPCEAEQAEKLEQLRALHIGARMHVSIVQDHGLGVDTPDDVADAENLLREVESERVLT